MMPKLKERKEKLAQEKRSRTVGETEWVQQRAEPSASPAGRAEMDDQLRLKIEEDTRQLKGILNVSTLSDSAKAEIHLDIKKLEQAHKLVTLKGFKDFLSAIEDEDSFGPDELKKRYVAFAKEGGFTIDRDDPKEKALKTVLQNKVYVGDEVAKAFEGLLSDAAWEKKAAGMDDSFRRLKTTAGAAAASPARSASPSLTGAKRGQSAAGPPAKRRGKDGKTGRPSKP